jgi:hypothetical protein
MRAAAAMSSPSKREVNDFRTSRSTEQPKQSSVFSRWFKKDTVPEFRTLRGKGLLHGAVTAIEVADVMMRC